MQKYSYNAKFYKIPSDVKFDKAFMGISVGQLYHEGQKFTATLKLINKRIKACTIGVCDTLQRHTMATMANTANSNIMHLPAKAAGDQWIERNSLACAEYLNIPYKIKRWDGYIKSKKYLDYRKEIDALYLKDKEFFKIVEDIAKNFNSRLRNRGYKFDEQIGQQNSREYLLEECAVFCSCYEEQYDVEISSYSRDEVVRFVLTRIKEKPLNFYKPLVVKYKKELIVDDPASKEALAKIIEVIPGNIYWMDETGKLLGCNKQMSEGLGFKKPGFFIRKYKGNFNKITEEFSKITDVVEENIKRNDEEVMKKKRLCIFEEEVTTKGQKKCFLSYKAPIIEQDKVNGIVGISLDITEKKNLEKKLIKQTKKLQSALLAKTEFLNTLSHEIRIPTHVICSICEEIYGNLYHFSREEIKGYFDTLMQNSKRLLRLIHNLLEVAKSEQHNAFYVFEKKNIVDIVEKTIDEFAHFGSLSFDTKYKKVMVKIDEIKFAQIMRNLIDNALKYGEGKVVLIKLCVIKDEVIIKVQNKGGGICETEKSKIFEPFFQGSNKIENDGTGLGLAICKKIIEAHKGSIWVEGNDPEWTSINFKMPCVKIDEEKHIIC